jgi:hypothetical protein
VLTYIVYTQLEKKASAARNAALSQPS